MAAVTATLRQQAIGAAALTVIITSDEAVRELNRLPAASMVHRCLSFATAKK